jgi:hypothetical protein
MLPKPTTFVPSLIAIHFIFIAAGCVTIPAPLAEDLPLEPLRTISVVDAVTGRPIPQAKVRCLVWSWYDIWTFTSAESDYSDTKPRTLEACAKGDPDLSFCHPHTTVFYTPAGAGRFTCRQHAYWGYQSYFWIGPLIGNDRFGHFAGTLVQAPNYRPLLIEIDQINPLPIDFPVHGCISADPLQCAPTSPHPTSAHFRDDGTLQIELTPFDAAAPATPPTK